MKYKQIETDKNYESHNGEVCIPFATFVDELGGRYQMDTMIDPTTKETIGFAIVERIKEGQLEGKYKLIPLIFTEAVNCFYEYIHSVHKKKGKTWYRNISNTKFLEKKKLNLKINTLEHEVHTLKLKIRHLSEGSPHWDKIISLDEDLKTMVRALNIIKYDPIGIVSIFMARKALSKIKNKEVFQKYFKV
jgi:hypothetical protein